MLPRKKERQHSGDDQVLRERIRHYPKRHWPRHRRWVRSHQCVVTLSTRDELLCNGPIEVSHIRTAANSGTGLKPHDSSAVPMCSDHHRVYHNAGHDTFEKRYGLNLADLAAELTAKSPDRAMRESLKGTPQQAAK